MKTPAGARARELARPIVGVLPTRAQRAARRVANREPRPGSRRARQAEALAGAEQERDQARRQAEERKTRIARLREERNSHRAAERRAVANAARWARAYQHLLAIIKRTSFEELGAPPTDAPYSKETLPDRRLAHRLVRWSLLSERIARGEPLEDAIADTVRALVAGGENRSARAISHSLQRRPATHVAGQLGSAIGATLLGWPRLAWANFNEVPAEIWRRVAADEYFRAGYIVDPAAALEQARSLLEDRPGDVPVAAWLAAARRTLVAGDRALARDLHRVATEVAAGTELDPDDADELTWLERWLGEWHNASLEHSSTEPTAPEPGHLSFALLDYKLPERQQASTNIGDHVQTVAAFGHLARHQQLRFTGADRALSGLATELQGRVQPDVRLETAARDVELVTVQRDASSLDDVPPDTWTIWFGWHMKEMSDRFDIPLHPHLRPIIVSFHCKHIQLLTPAAIDYLRTYGPIGCRDWSTVDILLSAGVPAFFSGCITTTVNTVFPPLGTGEEPGPDAPRVYVEVADTPADAPVLSHAYPEVKYAPFEANLRRAIDQLDTYRRQFSGVVTSRLHCYLPSRSLGVPAEFRPFHNADLRYEGLAGIGEEEFAAMRGRLLDKLETVTTAIVEGRSEEEVYATWRAACADDVAAAERRRAEISPLPAPWFDVPAACSAVRADATTIARRVEAREGDEVHVALALDRNLAEHLHVMAAAMVDNCTRPMHLWILYRDHDQADFARFAELFPEVTTTWLPCDAIDYGPVQGLLGHTTASTMDRLLLPELLHDLPRVVYADIDTLPVGDIAQLHDWDLDGAPLAARSAVGKREVTSGFGTIVSSATRLNDLPESSHDLMQRMCARFDYDFDAFNAGILVLDLERMRADDFCAAFLPFVERYGMNDQDVLNCYAGPHRAVLPPSWNAQPTKEIVTDPDIIHWTGAVKPWSEEYVLLQELWATYDERLRQRRLAGSS